MDRSVDPVRSGSPRTGGQCFRVNRKNFRNENAFKLIRKNNADRFRRFDDIDPALLSRKGRKFT